QSVFAVSLIAACSAGTAQAQAGASRDIEQVRYKVVADFDGATTGFDAGTPIQAGDGNLYMTAESGGSTDQGALSRLTRYGHFESLHAFLGPDGADPTDKLVIGPDGALYGTAVIGGSYDLCPSGCGTIFRITTAGVFSLVHVFTDPAVAANPLTMILASDGFF